MAVRVKVRLKALKGKKETIEEIALLNTGYESKEPEIVIPKETAEKLGLWPHLPDGTEVGDYEVGGGGKVRVYYIENCLEIQVLTEDTVSNPILVSAVIMEGEKEVLLSDKSISALQIVLEDAGKGIWRFKKEEKLRKSYSL
ncbi:MAG TPA: hypothetical protein ENG63_09445 [Candidatus Desulfofervidus auxilii]|uniref:Clan AA aspartic protease n=1 Tax=Desulfofervidus auxilii TaxID=1621989 RepID=A0A7C0U405_DESA2|nr:hypothetical protein [Candidatus Desulfofervidus auxilii]HDD45063.1 hypothetical protein [Candidatus Desulfofervidus auxilii]